MLQRKGVLSQSVLSLLQSQCSQLVTRILGCGTQVNAFTRYGPPWIWMLRYFCTGRYSWATPCLVFSFHQANRPAIIRAMNVNADMYILYDNIRGLSEVVWRELKGIWAICSKLSKMILVHSWIASKILSALSNWAPTTSQASWSA